MKLAYSAEDVERWRDKKYRRKFKPPVRNEGQALGFINSVGFCLASKADDIDLPNLWNLVETDQQRQTDVNSTRRYYLSYAWEIQSILPNHNSVYYGKVFRRRPSLISRKYFPYFYVLTGRTGAKDEHKTEFEKGRLSPAAKSVMDVLVYNSPMTAKELRCTLSAKVKRSGIGMERVLEELQRKMFVTRVVGNSGRTFSAEWAPVIKCFPAEVRLAKKISVEEARYAVLEKYFQNQLLCSVDTIHKAFGWTRQIVYQTVGQLVHDGVITTTIAGDGKKDKQYCLVH